MIFEIHSRDVRLIVRIGCHKSAFYERCIAGSRRGECESRKLNIAGIGNPSNGEDSNSAFAHFETERQDKRPDTQRVSHYL